MKLGMEIDVSREKVRVWRALKWLTEKGSEPRKVVLAAKAEDGFQAWQMLNQSFERYLADRQGTLMADFSSMAAHKAKSPKETRGLITEMERKMRIVEDITGIPIRDDHAKSVLVGFLDIQTRAQTASKFGQSTTFFELKSAVMEFANSMGGQNPCN